MPAWPSTPFARGHCPAIEFLYRNPSVRQRMSDNGRRAVREQFNWEHEEQKLLAIYEKLTAGRDSPDAIKGPQMNDCPTPDASTLLPPAEHDRWDEFALSSGRGTIFHTAWWHRAWAHPPVVRAMWDNRGQIEAGLCYAVGRRFVVRAIVRPPLTPRKPARSSFPKTTRPGTSNIRVKSRCC